MDFGLDDNDDKPAYTFTRRGKKSSLFDDDDQISTTKTSGFKDYSSLLDEELSLSDELNSLDIDAQLEALLGTKVLPLDGAKLTASSTSRLEPVTCAEISLEALISAIGTMKQAIMVEMGRHKDASVQDGSTIRHGKLSMSIDSYESNFYSAVSVYLDVFLGHLNRQKAAEMVSMDSDKAAKIIDHFWLSIIVKSSKRDSSSHSGHHSVTPDQSAAAIGLFKTFVSTLSLNSDSANFLSLCVEQFRQVLGREDRSMDIAEAAQRHLDARVASKNTTKKASTAPAEVLPTGLGLLKSLETRSHGANNLASQLPKGKGMACLFGDDL